MTAGSHRLIGAVLVSVMLVAGCSSSGSKRAGGYYKNDGPGSQVPANIRAIPDAVPRIEAQARANSRPYRVFGKSYTPMTGESAFRQKGIASWYGKKFHGNKTANGETYDMYAMTAAHPTLPIPSYAKVTRTANNKSVIVRINDRGPFHASRIIDLSYVAAAKLDLIAPGKGEVIVEAITNTDIARGNIPATTYTAAATAPKAVARATPAPQPTAIPASFGPALRTPPPSAAASDRHQDIPDVMLALQQTVSPADTPAPVQLALAHPSPPGADTSPRGVFLQFGAFNGAENAESLAARLNKEIAPLESRAAHIETRENLYRVQIGPYANRTEAVNAAVRIKAHTGTKATVATR